MDKLLSSTTIEEGVVKFVDWYCDFYNTLVCLLTALMIFTRFKNLHWPLSAWGMLGFL